MRDRLTDKISGLLIRLGASFDWQRALLIAFVAALCVNIGVNLIWVGSAFSGLKDLDSFLHSGIAYREGLNPYALHPDIQPPPISADALNLNPPISLYLFAPMSHLDAELVRIGFLIGSAALYAGVFAALLRAYPEKRTAMVVLTVVAMAGFWHMLWYLQIYAPLLVAIAGSWLLMRRGNLLMAGVLIGVVIAIKPNYALLPVLLFAAGHARVAISSIGVAAGISAIPLIIDGPEIYRQWLALSMDFQGMAWDSNASLMSVGTHFGVPIVGKVVAAAVVAWVLYFLWRNKPSVTDSTAIGLMAVLLFGPVSWAGYTLFLLPFLLSRRWDRLTWAGIFLLDAPFAPDRAGAAMEAGLKSGLGIALPSMHVPFSWPGLGLDLGLPSAAWFFEPFLGSMYAFAVVLLLAGAVMTLQVNRVRVPRPVRIRRPRTPVLTPPSVLAPAPILAPLTITSAHHLTPELSVSITATERGPPRLL